MKRVVRLRRCSLSVPGDSEKMLAKAQNIDCDQIILDLEDSVAYESKARARDNVSKAIKEKSFFAKTVSVRINGTDTEHCYWYVPITKLAIHQAYTRTDCGRSERDACIKGFYDG